MKNIDKYLEKYFEEKKNKYPDKWDESMEPLLKEMFQRRQSVLNLTDEEQKAEIETFFKNVNYIEIVEKSEDLEGRNIGALGFYVPNKDKIQICTEYYKYYKEEGYEEYGKNLYLDAFFHECSHAIGVEKSKESGLQHKEGKILPKWEGSAIEEAVTERTSTLMTSKVTKEYIDNHKVPTYSYQNITFASPALAAAFGVDEMEMIQQARSGGINAMNNYLLSNFNDKEKGEEYLENIYDNLDCLFNNTTSLYKVGNGNNSKNNEYMNNIVTNLKKAQNDRLAQNKDNISDFDEYLENEKYNNNRLDTILNDAIDINSDYLEDKNEIKNNLKSLSKGCKIKIDSMGIVNKNKSSFTEENFKDAMNTVSKDSFLLMLNLKTGKYMPNTFKINESLAKLDFSEVGKNDAQYEISEKKKNAAYDEVYKDGTEWNNQDMYKKIVKIMDQKQSLKKFAANAISSVWQGITEGKEDVDNKTIMNSIDVFRNVMNDEEKIENKDDNTKSERII